MKPTCSHIYDAIVNIAARRDLGAGPTGQRWMIDILGGSFEGPRLRGSVLAGGADRQLLRPDGIKLLDALYEMQTDDGAVLTVHNQVLIDDVPPAPRYARSVVKITAPDGPHAWLNRRMFGGTLTPLAPKRQAVKISVFELA